MPSYRCFPSWSLINLVLLKPTVGRGPSVEISHMLFFPAFSPLPYSKQKHQRTPHDREGTKDTGRWFSSQKRTTSNAAIDQTGRQKQYFGGSKMQCTPGQKPNRRDAKKKNTTTAEEYGFLGGVALPRANVEQASARTRAPARPS